MVGLNVKRLYALTFGLGAACVGAAGTMMTLIIDVTPIVGPTYTLLAFVIVITGGLGSMPGALVGGVLIGLTEALAGLLFTPSAKSMFAFGILVLVLLFRPQGILGKRPCMMSAALDRRPVADGPDSARGAACGIAGRAVARQRLSAHRPDRHSLFRLYRAGLEHHDGLCRAALARSCDLCGARRLRRGGCCSPGSASVPGSAFSRPSRLRRLVAPSLDFWRFRFGVAGVYFAILTIAFAEFARIGFDHLDFVNASAGLFLPVSQYTAQRSVAAARQSDACSTT